MKRLLIVCLLLLFGSTSFSQYSIRTGLGIELKNTSSFYDYINQNFAPANGQLKNFNTTVNFSGEIDRVINDNFDVGIEMAYGLYSYNYQYNLGVYKISTNNFMPSLLVYYVLNGEGYNFKFGGGAGLRFINVDELLPGTPTATTYRSTGVGFIIRGMGNTQVGKNLYANITTSLRYDLNSDVSNGSNNLFNPALNKNVKFNSFSAGLTLGITYLF